jgi:hypothetical protein
MPPRNSALPKFLNMDFNSTRLLLEKIISHTLFHQISGNKISQDIYEFLNSGKNVQIFL